MANKQDITKKKKNEVVKDAKIEGINKDSPNFGAGIVILVSTLVLLIIVLVGLYWYFEDINNNSNNNNTIEEKETDATKFKEEYESLNNEYNEKGDYNYLEVSVSKNNIIKYSSYDEIFKILENGSGVIYFGFPECPWCRNLVPELLASADEVGIDTIYYLNNLDERDIKSLDDDGNVVTEREGTAIYYKLVEKLDSVLGVYEGVSETEKRLYFPTVVFVKDGKIVDSHIGTLDSQESARVPLTNNQKTELKNILIDKMNKTITCDDAC